MSRHGPRAEHETGPHREPSGELLGDTLVMLLAGGQGERLYPLTRRRAKPAVSFAGLHRIVDFTLSNCVNSGLRRIYVLTQHKSLSLDRHVRQAWGALRTEFGEFVQTVPPQQQLVSRWYSGTADAIFQNLHLLQEERPRRVLILSGDHVYRMDYRPLLAFHAGTDALATIACTHAPREDARRMGVVVTNEAESRVLHFVEKSPEPPTLPGHPDESLVNMGVYVFDTEALVRAVIADAKRESEHDFGRDILPELVPSGRVHSYDVTARAPEEQRYWQDVGTLDGYFETSMALLGSRPPLDLADRHWPMRSVGSSRPPSLIRDAAGCSGSVSASILSPGCVVSGGRVHESILSPDVEVGPGAVVEQSILMPGVCIGAGVQMRRAIVDEGVVLPPGIRVGFDHEADARRFTVTAAGVVVVPDRAAFS